MDLAIQGTPPVANSISYTIETSTVNDILNRVERIIKGTSGINSATNADKNWIIAQSIATYIGDIIAFVIQGYLPMISNVNGNASILYKNIGDGADNKFTAAVIGDKMGRLQMALLEHYRICSFEGKYGMGRVVKTLSLLPSEKMKISIRTYKNSTITRTKAENVLDSYTENSASEFQKTVENENTDRDYYAMLST